MINVIQYLSVTLLSLSPLSMRAHFKGAEASFYIARGKYDTIQKCQKEICCKVNIFKWSLPPVIQAKFEEVEGTIMTVEVSQLNLYIT